MKERTKEFLFKWQIAIAFFLSVILIFTIGLIYKPNVSKYIYDSADYYNFSRSFEFSGKFSFDNFVGGVRGYFFPFIIYIYTTVGSILGLENGVGILLGMSLFTSFIITVILPSFYIKNNSSIYILRRLLPVGLLILFWRDLIYYPLTDLYSFGLLLLSGWLLLKVKNTNKIMSIIYCLLSGFVLYATYNTRTIYLFVAPIVLLIYIVFNYKHGLAVIAKSFACIFIGALICAYPQINTNFNTRGMYSPVVMTDKFSGGSLFNNQLFAGMLMERYETYIGSTAEYQVQGPLNFYDKAGVQIVAEEKITEISSLSQYIQLALKYPLDFMGIIARHFFNIFHLPYNHVYIQSLHNHKYFYTLVNYTILFIVGLRGFLAYRSKSKKLLGCLDESNLYLLSTLISCIMILPGAIEMRFFAPMYCLIYGSLAFSCPYKLIMTNIKKYKLQIFFGYIIILAFFCAIWGATLSSAQFIPQLLK